MRHDMIDRTFPASTSRLGEVFGRLDDADMLGVKRAPALFLGVANRGAG